MPMSKKQLTQEQVDAIVLPHGGVRTATNGISDYLTREAYWWNGRRGRACCVHVFSGDRADVRGHRCGKIAAVTETVGGRDLDFCSFHSSTQEAARAARQKAKRDEADRARQARWDQIDAQNKALQDVEVFRAALQKIADGTNDARAVAREALGIDAPAETY